ncbi:MAG TPA: TetR/AcrR family transcriptional regulator, partial [Methylophaga sp.]|nr:TetR/AcrR family transcriptional regulator [Methylophaga sp.]
MASDPRISKRQNIIKGAAALFLKHGFHTVSMDKVAQAAPVSKATLYKYFSSKDYLLAAVIDELCADLWQTMDEVSMDSSIENNLKKIATAFVDFIFSEQGLAIYRLVVAECNDFPELGELVYKTGPKTALSQLERYLAEINQQDQMRVTDISFAAGSFFSLLKGELHLQCLLGIKPLPSAIEKE